MFLSSADWQALGLSAQLAGIVTLLLIVACTPLAYTLAFKHRKINAFIQALVALPLILPPTVIGFYFLILFSPQGVVGETLQTLNLPNLAFSFEGLVLASMVYSLPFVTQPLTNAMANIHRGTLEAASTLGASTLDRFFYIILPQAKAGYVSAAVLGFAHTMGEFGIILMIGGSIPGETKVASIQIYEHVETLAQSQAHALSLVMLGFSLLVLVFVYSFNRRPL